ncbi:MAG: hypothetical protein IJ892_07460 [Prevotella sp.]|nr:hypothetical protein [Prevotella sp.]
MKRIILAMAVVGALFGCKAKEPASSTIGGDDKPGIATPKAKPTMPQGRLLRVTYLYQGMRMEEFGEYDLTRFPEEGGGKLKFRYRGDKVAYDVSDTLFDAARRIIDEEKLYELDSYYTFKSEYRVLDGYRWDFASYFEGKQTVSSGGRNAMPNSKGLSMIRDLLFAAARKCVENNEQPITQ